MNIKDLEKIYKEIAEKSNEINKEAICVEVLSWLCNNVPNFIDNQNKLFKIDLIVDDESENVFVETKKLQDIYKMVPDIEDGMEEDAKQLVVDKSGYFLNELDDIVKDIHGLMQNSELLETLYEKMIYFYELRGISRGNLLLEELIGSTDIVKFEYEAFSIPVKITKKMVNQETDENEIIGEEEYTIPEGFTAWIEISFKPATRANSMF